MDQLRGGFIRYMGRREYMSARDYRDLLAWKKAFELAVVLYKDTSEFPSEEKYGIVAQLRRASVSIVSNVAEGQGRGSKGEFLHFLSIALGSLAELETQIMISDLLGYFKQQQAPKLLEITAEVGRLMHGLRKSLNRSSN
jgi:four helix bundle protein